MQKQEKKDVNKRLEKAQRVADSWEKSRLAELQLHRQTQIKQYAEYKMLKGHSKEMAYKMAKAHILNNND